MNSQLSKQKRGAGWWIKNLALLVLILVAGTLGVAAIARWNLIKRYPAPGQLVAVDGHKMHIYCTGEFTSLSVRNNSHAQARQDSQLL